MNHRLRPLPMAIPMFLLAACTRHAPPVAHAASVSSPAATPSLKREVRVSGTIQAVHSSKILVPQIYGQSGAVTLVKFIPNGSRVTEGDLIAQFDATQQLDTARDAQAKYEDLGHQVDQKIAQNRSDSEKRASDLLQAEADLAKAEIELQKGAVLAEIDRLQDEAKAAAARKHVASLKVSNPLHDRADAAALRILELQRDRQKVTLERTQTNIEKLQLKAPLAGMVAHEMLSRGNSMGHAQEGDQLYRNQPLVSIFDPSEMSVRCMVGEPDGSVLLPGARATVYLDAYPDLAIPAHFESASPVASSALGSPVKTFTAVFKLDKTDPHLLPDLSAAVVIESPRSHTAGGAAQ